MNQLQALRRLDIAGIDRVYSVCNHTWVCRDLPVRSGVTECLPDVQGQLIGVALSFLRNFGIFSGASGVLGALSRGVAAIGTDQAAQEVLSPAFSAMTAAL